MKIIAITGPIASGKTVLSKKLSKILRYPLWSADVSVHDLIDRDVAVQQKIVSLFREAKGRGKEPIERYILKEVVLRSLENLKKLEVILHPFVERERRSFIQRARRNKFKGVILEIPLLFEVGLEKEVDSIILIETPPILSTKENFKKISYDT